MAEFRSHFGSSAPLAIMAGDGAPKLQEQLIDLLLEVRSLAGGPESDPKPLQRQPLPVLMEQVRTAVRLLVDLKQRQVQAAKDCEEEKEKNPNT